MNTLSLILLLHIYAGANLNSYYSSSAIVDDSRTNVQAQSTASSLKTITKLNSFFCGLTTNKNFLLEENTSFYSNRIMNTIVDPIRQEYTHIKTNPILTLLINSRCTAIKYAL